MKPEYIIGALMFLVAFGGLLITYFGPIAELREKMGKIIGINCQGGMDRLGVLEKKVGDIDLVGLSNRIVAMETKMSVFWDAIGDVVKDIIHHPTSPRRDDLVEKFPNLTMEEMRELRSMLIKERDELRANGATRNPQSQAYALSIVLQLARVQTALMDKEDS